MNRETEFHGVEICGGKGNFKKVPLDTRLEILTQLLAVIAGEAVFRGYVKINPANITHSPKPPDEIASCILSNKLMLSFKVLVLSEYCLVTMMSHKWAHLLHSCQSLGWVELNGAESMRLPTLLIQFTLQSLIIAA